VRRRARLAWHELGIIARLGAIALGLVLAALVAVFVLKWAPEWLAANDLKGNDKAEDVGRNRTALLAMLAGIIAVAGAMFTGLSYRLNRAGQITERFTRAIDQLGSSEVDVRLGGIYALERIARDSKDDHPQVVEVLTAYVREHARYSPSKSGTAETSSEQGQSEEADRAPRLETDVHAAVSVLARRDVFQDRPNGRLSLAGTDLSTLDLNAEEGGHLEGANLNGAHLERAQLSGVRLEGSSLRGAHLQGANLIGAHLEGAYVAAADLADAWLRDAQLEKADLSGAQLVRAFLLRANLDGATLFGADLEGANLNEAHLMGANLHGAHLQGAHLSGARLEGADLSLASLQSASLVGANLEGASLVGAMLEGVSYAETTWPTPEFESEARDRGARHVAEGHEPRRARPPG
jgi:uncharacterized protein YjbI with pentapeptide repeats